MRQYKACLPIPLVLNLRNDSKKALPVTTRNSPNPRVMSTYLAGQKHVYVLLHKKVPSEGVGHQLGSLDVRLGSFAAFSDSKGPINTTAVKPIPEAMEHSSVLIKNGT